MFRTASKPKLFILSIFMAFFASLLISSTASAANAETAQPSANIVASGNPVGIAYAPDGVGFWVATNLGQVANYGNADYFGSLPLGTVTSPIVAIASSAEVDGYWLVSSDGSVFTFGNAQYFGSMAGRHLDEPIVGMVVTEEGLGYYLIGKDGGIFAFGLANFAGVDRQPSNPTVGISVNDAVSSGYFVAYRDGSVFVDDGLKGGFASPPAKLVSPVVGITSNNFANGYYLVTAGGDVFAHNSPYFGSLANARFTGTVVAMAVNPQGSGLVGGYVLATSGGGVYGFGQYINTTPPIDIK